MVVHYTLNTDLLTLFSILSRNELQRNDPGLCIPEHRKRNMIRRGEKKGTFSLYIFILLCMLKKEGMDLHIKSF